MAAAIRAVHGAKTYAHTVLQILHILQRVPPSFLSEFLSPPTLLQSSTVHHRDISENQIPTIG
jgi:hypothetical protein